MGRRESKWKGIAFALAAAALFGASTPAAKALLPQIPPVLLAGLLYLGSGAGLGFYWLGRRAGKVPLREAGLKRKDLLWLALVIGFGGMLGPVLLMWGLARTAASSTALLLNLEGVFTAGLAWFVFKENFDRRIALGMVLITLGGISVTWLGKPGLGVPWGALGVIGACLAWAIDNNLTRKLSASDPVQIAALKGLGAGMVTTALALGLGQTLPGPQTVLAAGALGLFGYGISLVFFIQALRRVGTARTGAYFSTAPFLGALASILWLGERAGPGFLIAALLMAGGVWLHMTEHHEHVHEHPEFEHEHRHVHDEHHQHSHAPGIALTEPHSHWHRHKTLMHSHPHYPDLHHQYGH